MRVCRTIDEIRAYVRSARARGPVALVPTMGYFHAGHLALMRAAKQAYPTVVVSIFVNPLQFGPAEDLGSYPRDPARDRALAREQGVDAIFMPDPAEMYPSPPQTLVTVEKMSRVLCGRSRPGHFRGVATVVAKLFNIVRPGAAFFGQKDAQQLQVIRRMVRDLNFDIKIHAVPTVRERDGLALSSRNTYLTPQQRTAAGVLYRSLQDGARAVKAGENNRSAVERVMWDTLAAEPLAEPDYAAIYQLPDLQSVDILEGELLLAVAARFGRARLIDNMVVKGGGALAD